jgi:ParB family chromosome partitioning protein
MDEDKLLDLKQSISSIGILHPLVVLPFEDKFILISGYRRLAVAKQLLYPSIPAIVLQTGIDDAEIIRLHENIYREDISPIQEAAAFFRLEHTYHFNREKIAKITGRSKSYVTQRIQILDYPADIQDLLASSVLSYSLARELIRVKDPKQRQYFSTMIVTSGATVRTLLAWIKDYESNLPPVSDPPLDTATASPSTTDFSPPLNCTFCGNSSGDLKPGFFCPACYTELFPPPTP